MQTWEDINGLQKIGICLLSLLIPQFFCCLSHLVLQKIYDFRHGQRKPEIYMGIIISIVY